MEADCQAYVLAKERTSGTMCYVSSAKYTRRGVKVVYLGFVGTGESL